MKHLILIVFLIFTFSGIYAQNEMKTENNKSKLAVLWTSGDPEVAEKMAFMYTYNAKKQGWFKEVVLIIWGPSAKLLSENKMLQEYVKKMQDAGIKVEPQVRVEISPLFALSKEELCSKIKGKSIRGDKDIYLE